MAWTRRIIGMAEAEADLRARVVAGAIAAYRVGDLRGVGPAEVALAAGVPVADVHLAFPLWDLLVVAV